MDRLHKAVTAGPSHSADVIRETAWSENTRNACEYGWRRFNALCRSVDLAPQAAESGEIDRILVAMANEGPAGAKRPLAFTAVRLYRTGLNGQWRQMGSPSPASANTEDASLEGLARALGYTPRRVKALRERQIPALLRSFGGIPRGLLDAEVLSLGIAAAPRRLELCNLWTDDIENKGAAGALLHARRPKTDPRGDWQRVGGRAGQSHLADLSSGTLAECGEHLRRIGASGTAARPRAIQGSTRPKRWPVTRTQQFC